MQRLISILLIVASGYLLYNFRYRMLNTFLGKRFMRKLAVGLAMQIPFVRDKIVGSVLQFSRPQNA